MKKILVLVLMATTLVACDKSELEEAVIEMREEQKKDVNFQIFNDKLKGSKGDDAPQNQGGQSQSKPKEQ
jgi:hypothetical protein